MMVMLVSRASETTDESLGQTSVRAGKEITLQFTWNILKAPRGAKQIEHTQRQEDIWTWANSTSDETATQGHTGTTNVVSSWKKQNNKTKQKQRPKTCLCLRNTPISNTTLYLLHQMPFTSWCRTLSGFHPPTLPPLPPCEIQSSCWMTCREVLCYGLFSSYPVISLALNSIPEPSWGEGKLSTGTRCLLFVFFVFFVDRRVITLSLKWETTCKYKCRCMCCKRWLVYVGIPWNTLKPDPSISHKTVPVKREIVVCITIGFAPRTIMS